MRIPRRIWLLVMRFREAVAVVVFHSFLCISLFFFLSYCPHGLWVLFSIVPWFCISAIMQFTVVSPRCVLSSFRGALAGVLGSYNFVSVPNTNTSLIGLHFCTVLDSLDSLCDRGIRNLCLQPFLFLPRIMYFSISVVGLSVLISIFHWCCISVSQTECSPLNFGCVLLSVWVWLWVLGLISMHLSVPSVKSG